MLKILKNVGVDPRRTFKIFPNDGRKYKETPSTLHRLQLA